MSNPFDRSVALKSEVPTSARCPTAERQRLLPLPESENDSAGKPKLATRFAFIPNRPIVSLQPDPDVGAQRDGNATTRLDGEGRRGRADAEGTAARAGGPDEDLAKWRDFSALATSESRASQETVNVQVDIGTQDIK